MIGISTKNGILIVEFTNQLRDEGLAFIEALEKAAEVRLRPVLMTALSTIMGSIPLIMTAGRWLRKPYYARCGYLLRGLYGNADDLVRGAGVL